jgi:hypothetical protein
MLHKSPLQESTVERFCGRRSARLWKIVELGRTPLLTGVLLDTKLLFLYQGYTRDGDSCVRPLPVTCSQEGKTNAHASFCTLSVCVS